MGGDDEAKPEKKEEKVQRNNWDFVHLDVQGKAGLEDPPGFRMNFDDSGAGADKRKSKGANQELLEKKAWETALAPVQSVGMNLFMLWMSGSSPGIFNVMILGYCLTSIISQYTRMQTAFQNYKSIDTTMQKLAYFALCTASLAYLMWHASGMGLLPTSSGDWIAFIPTVEITEVSAGVMT
eukprot:gnl/TRDRNA2_/TRDRNA2_186044_c0_seq1.p1 gnl/TRDRNA2_/TRDRNA2_186044_c0~~gnl/TRDRNA2_/TRDRNA2_186044_c0_seq1.p1  ORF type:complete len:181 (-),score=43.64 gnl/TRDRNA2_/TRDRNA2_186044_c0_seq1:73-615(-)